LKFKLLVIAMILITNSSCLRTKKFIDGLAFKTFGTTLLSNAKMVSLKEIHLDSGSLLGQPVILEGVILDIGKYATHLVITDQSARMLVTLTALASEGIPDEGRASTSIRILGTVERGKKGLPFVSAIALTIPKITST
jgi:hypothetical protein